VIDGVRARAAVVGSPVAHSLSPVLHSAAYAELGLSGWTYEAVECTEAAFPEWFAGLDATWRGLSLTMPLKRVVLPLLHSVSPLGLAVGAVNTVTWDDEGRPVGNNTDVHGIVEALRSVGLSGAPASACVLGAGATACSAVAAVAELGVGDVVLLARSAGRAADALAVAGRVGVRARVAPLDSWAEVVAADVVVSTLPAAPAAEWAARLPSVRPAGVLLDVTYHPWPTPTATAWSSAGGVAVGGFEMLLHQAAGQFTLATGEPAPLGAMRVAGEKALACI
jgi:shikimate dehydrogenase